jgi:hypothetical protein
MNPEPSDRASTSLSLNAWEKHEKIAMHFNDLILKVRIQALGALAAVVTVGGVLLRTGPPGRNVPWGVVTWVFIVLLLLWIAIWLLDFLYYNRLLMGAVDSLLALEDAINTGAKLDFTMSHKIEDAVHGKTPTNRQEGILLGPLLFYCIVTVVLIVGMVYSATAFFCSPS